MIRKTLCAGTALLLMSPLTSIADMHEKHGDMHEKHDHMHEKPAAAGAKTECAIALLYSREGARMGTVNFKKDAEVVHVEANVNNLQANSKHGFHVHEYGDCSAADFTSAGGHFNPTDNPHAGPEAEQRHVGDLGNLDAGIDGTANYSRKDSKLALEGNASILGRAVIVHEKADDLQSQPTGDAGGRIACGVIGACKGGM